MNKKKPKRKTQKELQMEMEMEITTTSTDFNAITIVYRNMDCESVKWLNSQLLLDFLFSQRKKS